MSSIASHFSGSYAEARRKFLDAAQDRQARIQSIELPEHRGALGEVLAMDVARLGPAQASRLIIVSAGTHGPEGFCGSGCQVALLRDDDLLRRLDESGLGLLLVHAVNPHGFSHLRRVNEDNIDLNRNHVDFARPLPVNADYAAVDALALPANWPPTAEQHAALADYIAQHGMAAYRAALSRGQYTVPDGLFYGGTAPSWSNRTIRALLREHAATVTHLAWIDVHTGLGPWGHGEKIFPGRAAGLPLARSLWGADVLAMFEAGSASPDVSGPVVSAAYDECPQALFAPMGLEFGTLPDQQVLDRLRADCWLHRHPEADDVQRRAIRRDVRDAFYCDDDAWKGMVLGQARVVMLQTVLGLARAA